MTASKKAFDMSRDGNVYAADPINELCLVGGTRLPEEQRGPLDIDGDETHPLYDERIFLPVDENMVANVDYYGVNTAISIAKVDGIAMVVAGRQRVRWARIVNRRRAQRGEPPIKVRATVVRSNDTRLIGVMISENAVRTEEDPITRIAKLKRFMERGVSAEDAAVTFGVSLATVKQWLAFEDNATTKVKSAVEAGKLSLTAGMEIARIKDPEKQAEALKELASAPATGKKSSGVRAARVAAKKATKGGSGHVGIPDKRTQTKLLRAVEAMNHKNASDKTLAFWEGVEAALGAVIGDEEPDERLAKVLAEVLK